MSGAGPLDGLRIAVRGRAAAAVWGARILEQLGASIARPDDGERAVGAEVWLGDGPVPGLRQDGAVVRVSITPFGANGRNTACADAVVAGVALEDPTVVALTGAHAAVAALAALRWARRSGRSARVEMAALEVVAGCLGDVLLPFLCSRRRAAPTASAPATEVLACADGYVGVAAPTPVHREHLARLTGLDAVRDPRMPLGDALASWLAARTRDEVVDLAQLWQIPAVPVLDSAEVLRDPQCVARGVWMRDEAGDIWPRSPFRLQRQVRHAGKAVAVRRRQVQRRSAHRRAGLPLDDVRVLDLGMVWAGPYCARLLAGLGASVVKVEGPRHADGTRPSDARECAGVFADLNRGKRSLALDLSTAGGRALFLQLVERADVVVENFSPRVMPNFGLDRATLAQVNPTLIGVSMPAFGSTGPWANYVAYGSGLELATGLAPPGPDGRPRPSPVPYLDYLAGAYAAAGVLAALIARDCDGRGAHIELAQREVACQLLGWTRSGSVAKRPDEGPGEPIARWAYGDLDAAALAADPRLTARGIFSGDRAAGPCAHLARVPWRICDIPRRIERPAPVLGAHSRAVLRGVGVDDTTIAQLVSAGIILDASEQEGEHA